MGTSPVQKAKERQKAHMLVRVVKNWTYPDLLRQTPSCSGIWDSVLFTLDPVDECDALLVLNEPKESIAVRCPPENVWALFQEPYLPDFMPWQKVRHEQFSRVYTPSPPDGDVRYHASPPLVPWHVGRTIDELAKNAIPPKDDRIAWITSSLEVLPGHFKRNAFRRFLADCDWPNLDVCGRGIKPVNDKWDILAPCRYAIAVENDYGPNYWTEKIADCWLAHALPFYYGCPNLEEYFPSDSFVRIDLNDFEAAASTIRTMVDAGEYERRLPAIREARELILNRFQFFPFMASELCSYHKLSAPTEVRLLPFRQSPLQRIRNHCIQAYHLRKARSSYTY